MDLGLVLLVTQWCVGWWIGLGLRTLPRVSSDRSVCGPLAVVIPARNEAHQIATLLSSLRAQTQSPAEVVVVDDGSHDDTAVVVQAHGVRVVTAGELPPDWNGKAFACDSGVRATTAPVLVFLDADTWLEPDALARIGAVVRNDLLVSVQPWHDTPTIGEGLSAANNLLALQGAGLTGLRRRPPRAIAFGPCIAMTRETYQRIGGFAAVRNRIPEDLALAQTAAASGVAVEAYAGQSAVSFRMYPDGVAAMVRGFARNLASGMGVTRVWRLCAVIWWIIGCVSAAGLGVQALIPTATMLVRVVGVLAVVAFAVQWAVIVRGAGRFGFVGTWLYPIPLLMFAVALLRSVWWRVTGRALRWRGRAVHSHSAARP